MRFPKILGKRSGEEPRINPRFSALDIAYALALVEGSRGREGLSGILFRQQAPDSYPGGIRK
jgi:hypothetical protein